MKTEVEIKYLQNWKLTMICRALSFHRNRFLLLTTTLTTTLNFASVSTLASTSTSRSAECDTATMATTLRVLNWNVAAINNNPFEYWITYENEVYTKLMDDVQRFIENPGDEDVPVHQVFTDDMFQELSMLMDNQWDNHGIKEVGKMWENEYRDRKIVSEFIKDEEIGSKRLTSMPDRITNTINTVDGAQIYRPTAINCYEREFHSFQDWWEQWKGFMFEEQVSISSGKTSNVASMLVPIKRAKYPAITEEEERISLPLQTMCAAIFDAILIHMLNTVGGDVWQPLRREMCQALNLRKNDRTIEILDQTYGDSDIMFLQEVANSFVPKVEESNLGKKFAIFSPTTSRDQNSVILLNRDVFDIESTEEQEFDFDKSVPVAQGDLFAINAKTKQGVWLFLASFHGDTNGLATPPVLQAIHDLKPGNLIFGLDANTYEKSKPGKTLGIEEFTQDLNSKGMNSCWGKTPDPKNYTTFNARTFLQPQLNKAATRSQFFEKGDVNPKDFILFYDTEFEATETTKDNTGKRSYIENMVFPTLQFPSDHAIIFTTLAKL